MRAHDPPKRASGAGAESMLGKEPDPAVALLQDRLAAGASSRELAAAVGSAFEGIDQELMPILGHRGVGALYRRTVHLARQAHPWLPTPPADGPVAIDASALTTSLAQRPASEAAAAGAALVQTFCELLAGLIGVSLTEKLLRPVWAHFLSGPSAEDNTR